MKVILITRCLNFTDLRPAFIPPPQEAISPSYAPTLTEPKNEWGNKLAFQKERERNSERRERRAIKLFSGDWLRWAKTVGGCVHTYTNNLNHQMYKRHQHENTNVQNYESLVENAEHRKCIRLQVHWGKNCSIQHPTLCNSHAFKSEENKLAPLFCSAMHRRYSPAHFTQSRILSCIAHVRPSTWTIN